MTKQPGWLYDEAKTAGVDYADPARVEEYDRRHGKFRDYRKEAEAIVKAIGIRPEDTVIDLGSGTGAFALNAAPYCRTLYAVDVSPVMLDYARRKAERAGLTNVVFRPGGFLTYEHRGPAADALVSSAVLHHLPDFWKLIGLRRAARMLKTGGRFFLFDVVFPIGLADCKKRLDDWVRAFAEKAGPEMAAEAEVHLRDEYSTYDRVLEEFLVQAGFRIDSAKYEDFLATYLCTRT
ncbi:MAG TPA: class I SAM-dependent methyltransferase [bacterium]|nr:class I SAM-dependent methyltransferase [bacterium]HNS48266.1 class I SAM-dependent methyltransferase [bacterium]